MQRLLKIFRKQFFLILLFGLVLVIILTNFHRATYLSGWDNLHPEFGFLFNIKRSLFSVWQEYQGLGLLGGMGHASDLPRQIFLWVVSVIIPTQYLRYFYHFLTLLLGPLGVYILLKNIILKKYHSLESKIASVIGSVFYLFNLATVQMFYVPYEPFSTHYAALPWLFFANLNFIHNNTRRNLFLLLLVNILATPQGYVGTIFFVYTLTLSLLFIFLLISNLKFFKNIILAYLILFLVNAYWILPNAHFVLNKSHVNIESKSNQMVTEDNFLKNKKYGNLPNVILLKGFWFDNIEIDVNGNWNYQLSLWGDHLENRYIILAGYLIFGLCLVGIIGSFRLKLRERYPFLAIFLFTFILLANDTPIFSYLSSLFYKTPLFTQAFRTPYTKFAFTFSLTLSIYFAISSVYIGKFWKKLFIKKSFYTFLFFLPLFFCYPIFKGHFFYEKVRAKIPQDYFQTFAFFNQQNPNERVANFPQHTYWGWTFYRWNYSGSGFLWYGMEQPIMDRTFDVWSSENENYFHEISYAIYSGNRDLFEKVLEKYQIRWLILDENVASFSNTKELYTDKLNNIINASDMITLVEEFGKIKIYEAQLDTTPNNFVFLDDSFPHINPKYKWNNYDVAYDEYKNYISNNNESITPNPELTTVYYPFRTLFTGKRQEDIEFTISENEESFLLTAILAKELAGAKLFIPPILPEDALEIKSEEISEANVKYPKILIDGELVLYDPTGEETNIVELPYIKEGKLEVVLPKIKGLFSYDNEVTQDVLAKVPYNCDQFSSGILQRELIKHEVQDFVRLISLNASNCIDINLPQLAHKLGYIVKIDSWYEGGKSLLFSVNNSISQRTDLESYLPKKSEQITFSYIVIPPMESFGLGYNLHIENNSIGSVKTVNDLGRVTVNPIPYRFLTGLKIVKQSSARNFEPSKSIVEGLSVQHPNPSYYQITYNREHITNNNTTLILSQSFDEGWKAYKINIKDQKSNIKNIFIKIFPFMIGEAIKDHVLVNNWENGWMLDNETMKQCDNDTMKCTIAIVYLPQYLEYLGFLLLLLLPFIIFMYPRSSNKKNIGTIQ